MRMMVQIALRVRDQGGSSSIIVPNQVMDSGDGLPLIAHLQD